MILIAAAIFDLDGILVSTDEYHYQAWGKIAAEEGIFFDRAVNQRLRGVSRMESLSIILEKATRPYSEDERAALAERKNTLYRQLLEKLGPSDILPGVSGFLNELRHAEIRTAIGSSSKNAPFILERLGLATLFDASVDGTEIRHSKPDPEVFLKAAEKLGVSPTDCAVFEDADSGILAAERAGMIPVRIGPPSTVAARMTFAGFAGIHALEYFQLR